MKIQYRGLFHIRENTVEIQEIVRKLGFVISSEPNFLEIIKFSEGDPHCNELIALFENKKGGILQAKSIFEEKERLSADYLAMNATSQHGYPQPEDDYLEECYNLTYYCEKCGLGASQIAPLRMRAEPNWGTRQIIQLNWVFDEFFVKPEIYDSIFSKLGLGSRVVMHNKKNVALDTVVQLEIPVVESPAVMDGYKFQVCENCYKKKYYPFEVGKYPALSKLTKLPIFKSQEFYGDGASGYHQVFVNQETYRLFLDKRIKGVTFIPTK
jgi:hypothetical protein